MVTTERAELRVERRDLLGKKVRSLRRQGVTPANIYGRHLESVAVEVATSALVHVLRTAGRNEIVYLSLDEEAPRPTFVRQVQRNPTTDEILHVDFYQISLTEKVRLQVPIVLVGKAPAVDMFGGTLLHSLDHITVEGLPADIPSQVEVDVSGLDTLEAGIHVNDLLVGPGLTVLTDPEVVVATVVPPKVEEEEVAPVEEAAPEEGVEAAPEAEEAAEQEKE